jgi:predicted phosphoribosyltransferase
MIFRDRTQAAEMLGKKLQRFKEEWHNSLIILAIPRGGAVTGQVIADALDVGLDLVVAKKLADPLNPEFAIGAVLHDGSFVLNEDAIGFRNIPKAYVDQNVSRLKNEIDRRLLKFRGHNRYDLSGKVAIIVDDGVATGATMFAAIKWLKTQGLRKLIVAIPVGPRDTIEKLRDIVDEVVVLHSPSVFGAVGAFYEDFSQVTDDEVMEIMRNRRISLI